jgi:hypothetical protein
MNDPVKENAILKKNKDPQLVLPVHKYDAHLEHINIHKHLCNLKSVRRDDAKLAAVLTHIQAHVEKYRELTTL